MDSILTSIKKLLGIDKAYNHFDNDIIIHINSVFLDLAQIGVGPEEGFSIEDDLDTWDDFIPNNPKLEAVKTLMYLKVKLIFDPPLSSTVIEAMNRQIDRLEWRLSVAVDPGEEETQNG